MASVQPFSAAARGDPGGGGARRNDTTLSAMRTIRWFSVSLKLHGSRTACSPGGCGAREATARTRSSRSGGRTSGYWSTMRWMAELGRVALLARGASGPGPRWSSGSPLACRFPAADRGGGRRAGPALLFEARSPGRTSSSAGGRSRQAALPVGRASPSFATFFVTFSRSRHLGPWAEATGKGPARRAALQPA